VSFNIKIDKYDRRFAKFIKLRDVVCQRCGATNGKLECSHIFSRRNRGLRFDPENAKLLCFGCHRDWHENPVSGTDWLKRLIGEDAYDRLKLRASKPTKLSTFDMDIIYAKLGEAIKKLESIPEEDRIHERFMFKYRRRHPAADGQ
jgi:hypothetical protein